MPIFGEYKNQNDIRNKLPLENLVENKDLAFMLEIIFLMEIKENNCNNFFAGVGLNEDKKLSLLVNTEYLSKLPISEQLYILIHEISHVLFYHLAKAKYYSNLYIANIAEDAVVNSLINRTYAKEGYISMPKKGGEEIGYTLEYLESQNLLTKKDWEEFGKNKAEELNSDEVYKILLKKIKEKAERTAAGEAEEGQENKSVKQIEIEEDIAKEMDKRRLDQHNNLTNQEIADEIEVEIKKIIKQAEAGVWGDEAINFVRGLKKIIKKNFPFDKILDKIIYKQRYDFSREHRRIHLPKVFLPRKTGERFKVYAMIDVSGSVYDYTEDFMGYVAALPEFEELILVDTKIQRIYKKGDPLPTTSPGGGGTDLNPGFKRWEEIERKSKGFKLNFVCLTDGEIPELNYGPTRSKVIIFTTDQEVTYSGASRRFLNIKIKKGDY